MREQQISLMLETKVIAIIRGLDGGYIPLVQAMYDGGIRAVEVTFNQKSPEESYKTADTIHDLDSAFGGKMLIGAGTVTSVELAELAHSAGAKFIVSPDTNPDVIHRTRELGMISMPGAMTPSEILRAHRAGADFVKVFPAANLGPDYIKAIRGPLNQVRLLAVGGVSEKNAAAFMRAGCVGVGVGGNLVNREWIARGEFKKIEALARELCRSVRDR